MDSIQHDPDVKRQEIEEESLSTIGNFPSDADLCDTCKALATKDAVLWQVVANGNGKVGFPHHDSATALQKSASTGCPLCSLMWNALKEHHKEKIPDDEAINLFFWRDLSTDFFTGDQRDEFRLDVHCGDHDSKFVGHLNCYPGREDYSQMFTLGTKALLEDVSTESAASINRIEAWITMCNEEHPECKALRPKQYPLPTRVIEVGKVDSEECKLVSGDGKESLYAALSHSWGSFHPLTTTKDTLEQRQQAIPDTSLPNSFRDAVNVCRKLGIPYLWIDSLCIIQDSKEDWAREAPTMGAVYTNATITISAMAAADSTEGCFKARDGLSLWPVLATIFKLPCLIFRHPTFFAEVYGDLRALDDRALDQRAWILQEQVLAQRTLGFGKQELTWQCTSLAASETHPLGLPRIPQLAMDYRGLLHRVLNGDERMEKLGKARVYGFWYRTVMDFTARKLTYTKDKLPAISGLAKRFAAALGDEYIAGLWKSDIYTGLLWKSGADVATAVPTKRAVEPRAPSWSWASVDGFIDYVRVVPSLDQPENIKVGPLARLLAIEDPATSAEHPFGQTSSARLRFSGHMFGVRYQGGTLQRINEASDVLEELGRFWPDASEVTEGTWICMPLCVVVKSEDYDQDELISEKVAGDGIWCLVLKEVDAAAKQFQRVGICRLVSEDVCVGIMEKLSDVQEIDIS